MRLPSRLQAASLVERLRDGEITNFEFESAWPTEGDPDKRALRAVRTMLWRYYSDLYEHKLDGKHRLSLEGREQFNLCALFLRSGLEYEWAIDDFMQSGPSAPSSPASVLGLSNPPDIDYQKLNEEELLSIKAFGLNAIWPFFREEDLARAKRAYQEEPPWSDGGEKSWK